MIPLGSDFHAALVRRLIDEEYPKGPNDPCSRWSTQGFGMARLYLDNTRDLRLNIWHSALAIPGLTPETGMVHTHPWDFSSRIIAGELRNHRYRWDPAQSPSSAWNWRRAEITPGPGGSVTGDDGRATQPSGYETRQSGVLNHITRSYGDRSFHAEVYGPGHSYSQRFDEIHHTEYVDGTVTINRRDRGDRPDRAFTFWRADHDWISAEPNLIRHAGWSEAPRDLLLAALDAALELLEDS